MPLVFLDVETTGLSPHWGDRICEVALMRVRNGKRDCSFESLVNPGRAISAAASYVNGITDSMVRNAPSFNNIASRILPYLNKAVIVCHNAQFDLSFLHRELALLKMPLGIINVIDTLYIARRYYYFKSNSLGNIARELNMPAQCEHRAMVDVNTTKNIFLYFFDDLITHKRIGCIEDLYMTVDVLKRISAPGSIALPPLIEDALCSRKTVTIQYMSGYGVKSIREIVPMEIIEHHRCVYLRAYCHLKKEERTFRLDRIVKLGVKGVD